ncbi:MAG: phosphoribosylanthranilate isomerase [Oligosphaeraceae bacterium]|nr:phosphoribosylanthranilate isomerase [Oligosphaeraceae bacterium]
MAAGSSPVRLQPCSAWGRTGRVLFPAQLVQIAGVVDWEEAGMLLSAGCTCLGFPLRLPVNLTDHSEAEARAIIRRLPAEVLPVLICYEKNALEIDRFASFLGVAAVQLHGAIELGELAALRRRRPDLLLIKSLIVHPGLSLPLAVQCLRRQMPYIDAFILDSYDAASGATGATGLVHDWSISRALVQESSRPVILAGGLTPANVGNAIISVRPAGVDAHTGLEGPDGRKDPALVRAFLQAAGTAFQTLCP